MARHVPATTAVLTSAVPIAGLTLAAFAERGTPWAPALVVATFAVLGITQFALVRVRHWIDTATAQVHDQLAAILTEQAGLVAQRRQLTTEITTWQHQRAQEQRETELQIAGLVTLLFTTRSELLQAEGATAAARAELADLSREWNALVQEAMQMGADVFSRKSAGPQQMTQELQ